METKCLKHGEPIEPCPKCGNKNCESLSNEQFRCKNGKIVEVTYNFECFKCGHIEAKNDK